MWPGRTLSSRLWYPDSNITMVKLSKNGCLIHIDVGDMFISTCSTARNCIKSIAHVELNWVGEIVLAQKYKSSWLRFWAYWPWLYKIMRPFYDLLSLVRWVLKKHKCAWACACKRDELVILIDSIVGHIPNVAIYWQWFDSPLVVSCVSVFLNESQ